jgi:hypothetical protein
VTRTATNRKRRSRLVSRAQLYVRLRRYDLP